MPEEQNLPIEGEDVNVEQEETTVPTEQEKTYTQADIDEIIKNRLAREKRKQEDAVKKATEDAEKRNLLEKEEYKALYEKLQLEVDRKNVEALESKKESLLAKAGYTDTQIERYKRYVVGETAEELAASIEELVADIPPVKTVGVDPVVRNPNTHKPAPTDLRNKGKEFMERLINKKQ